MAQTYPCMITDSRNNPLSRGILENAPSEGIWYVRVLDGGMEQVRGHKIVQLIGMADELPGMTGSIVGSRGSDVLIVEHIRSLGIEARQNLRVPVRFESFLYPVSGSWKGRRSIVSQDLSCGGIAFFCSPPPEIGETVELVVPITAPQGKNHPPQSHFSRRRPCRVRRICGYDPRRGGSGAGGGLQSADPQPHRRLTPDKIFPKGLLV